MSDLLVNHKFQVLHFLVRNVKVCIEIKYIKKIIPLVLIEKIPQSPSYVAGIINYAGNGIPVINLNQYLGYEARDSYSLNTPILLCSDEQHTAGLIIDQVIGLDEVEEKSVQMHDEFSKDNAAFVGAIIFNTQVSLLLDVKRLLNVSLTPITSSFKNTAHDAISKRETPS